MILLSTVLFNNWKTIQINSILDFPLAPFERKCYMKIPKGIEIHSDTEWVLKVNQNIYRQHQEGRVLNDFLVGKLASMTL